MTQGDGVFADPRGLAAAGSNSRPRPATCTWTVSWRQSQRLVHCGARRQANSNIGPLLDLPHALLRAGRIEIARMESDDAAHLETWRTRAS